MIRGNPIESLGAGGQAAKDVSTADDDADLDAQGMDVLDFGCDTANKLRVDAEVLFTHQNFAAQLQQDPFVFWFQIIGPKPLGRLPPDPFGAFPGLRRS